METYIPIIVLRLKIILNILIYTLNRKYMNEINKK